MKLGGTLATFACLATALVALGGLAAAGCSNSSGATGGGDGGNICSSPPQVQGASLQQCSSCSGGGACQVNAPLDACCTWVAEARDPLAIGVGLHRYSTSSAGATPDLSCIAQPKTLGTPMQGGVTLTGYVWLFSSGNDSSGVKVDVYQENHPSAPDGSLGAVVGSYTTSMNDPAEPIDTTWNSKCPTGCQFRQYKITGVPTETPLIIRTSDAASNGWATLYDYDIYFPNSAVQMMNGVPTVTYDATAVAGPDLSTVAGTVGQTIESNMGLLAGEVHDCSDLRLGGATVGTTVTTATQVLYFTSDEGNPLPTQAASDTSDLSLFGALNLPTGQPIRVTATGQCPATAPMSVCSPGNNVMLGTYVVQVYPGAVTAISLRGRRPWQP